MASSSSGQQAREQKRSAGRQDSGVYPDWAKVGASVSAPSEGAGSTLGGETDNDDLGGGDDDFDY